MDTGEEKIEDENLIKRLRVKARRIHLRALITAVTITVVAVLFPNIN